MINEIDTMFKHPFCMTVAGPSQCGKTTFIMDLLINRNKLINPPPKRIVYCYSVWQKNYDDIKYNINNIEFNEGISSLKDIDSDENNLVILDDLMTECVDNKDIVKLFTVGSHHKNISVIFLTQNIFSNGKHTRSITLNSHYLVLFRNPRDPSQVWHIGRQMYPKHLKFFEESFTDAVSVPYGFLIVDLKQDTPEEIRLRTIDKSKGTIFVYVKK